MHHQISVLILFSFIVLTQSSLVEPKRNGFTVDLIHPDSILSPFYNRSVTPWELTRKAAMRSLNRANHFNTKNTESPVMVSPVISDGADHLVEIYASPTQQQKLYLLLGTASELTWIQCKPCKNSNDENVALYDPEISKTYEALSVDDKLCQDFFFRRPGTGRSRKCKYSYYYEKNAFTIGILSTETFYFVPTEGEPILFPKLVFGCSHRNEVKSSNKVQGVIGLGNGQFSFVSQLGDRSEHKFSYCLVPPSAKTASKLSFGHEEKISKTRVSTPFVFRDHKPYYYLSLEGITIEYQKIPIEEEHRSMIIDSGTPMTVLHSSIYDPMTQRVSKLIGLSPIRDRTGTFSFCYDSWRDLTYPDLVFNFANADVLLKRKNLYISYLDYICMTIIRSDEISIFGSSAQVNFHVEYDLIQEQVSFTPKDCTKFGISV